MRFISPLFKKLYTRSLLLTALFLFPAACGFLSHAAIYTGGSGSGSSSSQFGPPMFSGGQGSGYSSASSSDLAVGYGEAAKLSFTTAPSSGGYAGVAFSTQPVVRVLDANDNLVHNATNTVTLAIANDAAGSGSALGGTVEMAAVSGIADFSGKGVYVSRAGSGFTLSASSSGLTSAVCSSFNIISPIQITSPNGAETWTISTAYDVTWNTYGSLAAGTNTLAYSLNNGTSWTTLTTSGTTPYSWVTPSSTSTQALVRVTNSSDSTFTDSSDAVFTLAAGFNLIVPNGGEAWAQGFAHTIQWATRGTVENVKLEYYDGSTWNSITNSTANLNQYSWTPEVSAGGAGFKIRVSDVTNANANDESASAFTLQRIAVSAPTSGQRIQAGSSTNITWSAQGMDTVKIEYSIDGGTSWSQISGAESLGAGLGTYSWNIPSSFTTSINTKVRVMSTTADSDGNYASSSSSAFTIYGQITVSSPNASGIEWAAGAAHDITWATNKGTITNVKIEYSLDNFISDVNTIVESTSNTGTYSWMPASTGVNFKIRVSDAQDSSTSDTSDNYFSVTGIGITSPASGATWNCGSTQSIAWNYTGSFNFVKIEYYNGSSWSVITNSVANTGSYSWTVPTGPTNAAQVRVSDASDADPTGTSSAFNIKSVLTVTAPNGGESLSAGDSTDITWANTGTVSNVKLEYYNGSSWVTIIASTANSTPASGGSYSWTVPTALSSSAKVRVSDVDANHPSSNDESDSAFTIKAGFTVTSPASAAEWAVSEARNITWTNTATVTHVRLYYATEIDSYATWTEITSGAEANTNTYAWTVSDIIQAVGRDPQSYPTLGVKIKVADATSGNPASSALSSAFNVIYYTITFYVKDSETNAHLSALSVTCSSGWSATNRTSGVNAARKYPYGAYVTIWSRTGYDDKSVDWTADSTKTVTVTMTGSLVDTIVYNVYSNFSYDAASSAFKINSWLEKTGKTVSTPTSCVIYIYDKDGQTIDTLSSSSPDASGVFRLDWDTTGLNSNTTYFARVEIVSRSSTYSSHVVYSLSVPQSLELSTISSTVSEISTSVGSNLGTNVSAIQTSVGENLGTNVTAVQTSVGSNLGTNVSAIQSSVGSSLGTKVDTLQTDVTSIKSAVGASESTTLYSKVGTLISEIGSGNISAIRTSTDSLAGGDLGSLGTDVTAIKAKTDTINWSDIGTIKTKTDTINWSDVTTVKSNLSTLSTTVDTLSTKIDTISSNVSSIKAIAGTTSDTSSNNTLYGKIQGLSSGTSSVSDGWGSNTAADIITKIDDMQEDLGTPSDSSSMRTVFGKIAEVSAQAGEISSVYTAANDAYTQAQDLREELAYQGKSESAYGMASSLKETVSEIKQKLDEAVQGLGDKQISDVAASVEEAKAAIKQAAQATGALAAAKETGRQAGTGGNNNLESLRDDVKEIRAMIEAVKVIVERQEEPAVKSSFENE